jgi:hypothetical protein
MGLIKDLVSGNPLCNCLCQQRCSHQKTGRPASGATWYNDIGSLKTEYGGAPASHTISKQSETVARHASRIVAQHDIIEQRRKTLPNALQSETVDRHATQTLSSHLFCRVTLCVKRVGGRRIHASHDATSDLLHSRRLSPDTPHASSHSMISLSGVGRRCHPSLQ